jgi:nitrite reductase (NO-forming)
VDAVYLGQQAVAGSEAERRVGELQAQRTAAIAANPQIAGLTKEIQMEKGRNVYMQTCYACHQPEGEGLPGVFPPLAKADYLMADKDRSIHIVLQGMSGAITVNGKDYNSAMPVFDLTDDQVANVLTYVRNSFGNSGDAVSVDEVKRVRAAIGGTN